MQHPVSESSLYHLHHLSYIITYSNYMYSPQIRSGLRWTLHDIAFIIMFMNFNSTVLHFRIQFQYVKLNNTTANSPGIKFPIKHQLIESASFQSFKYCPDFHDIRKLAIESWPQVIIMAMKAYDPHRLQWQTHYITPSQFPPHHLHMPLCCLSRLKNDLAISEEEEEDEEEEEEEEEQEPLKHRPKHATTKRHKVSKSCTLLSKSSVHSSHIFGPI